MSETREKLTEIAERYGLGIRLPALEEAERLGYERGVRDAAEECAKEMREADKQTIAPFEAQWCMNRILALLERKEGT